MARKRDGGAAKRVAMTMGSITLACSLAVPAALADEGTQAPAAAPVEAQAQVQEPQSSATPDSQEPLELQEPQAPADGDGAQAVPDATADTPDGPQAPGDPQQPSGAAGCW